MHAVRLGVAVASVVTAAFASAAAPAAIVITPGADTVSTPRLELDFGDSAANVERLDSVRWRDSTGLLGGNLAANDGSGGCDAPAPPFHWGEAGSTGGAPQPVGSGSAGSWALRATRTVEIGSSRPISCTGDSTVTPVRTRYTFFNVGDGAGRFRVERTFSFSASTPAYATTGLRPYVPRLPLASYTQVVHPNAAGNALVTDASQNPATTTTAWNGTWVALNDPSTNAGLLILRESATSARLSLENDGTANSSAVELIKPGAGWKAAVTETEWLCFYDATSWPPGSRAPNVLPSGCAIVAVPINTGVPMISGEAKVTGTVTASTGTWDSASSFATQWLRCGAGGCAPIAGATGASYTPVAADEGSRLRADVTATAPGGEIDTASSALSEPVAGGPPQNSALPVVTGEAREDEVLTGSTGAWSDAPTSFQYQWRRCSTAAGTGCSDVAGATASTYKLTRNDVGATMRVRVVATNAAGASLPAESAPTGEIQREVIRASFTVAPQPTCTGVKTTIDATASKTPNGPIARYRVTYKEMPVPEYIGIVIGVGVENLFGLNANAAPIIAQALETLPVVPLYDGPSATPSFRFTWNRQITANEVKLHLGKAGAYVRDLVWVTVVVTDKAGATASATRAVELAQFYSDATRKDCPKVRATVTRPSHEINIDDPGSVSSNAIVQKVSCEAAIDCAGSVFVFRAPAKVRARRAAKARPVLLARNAIFHIPAKSRATIRAKLTKAGRALAKRHKAIRAREQLTFIDPLTAHRTTTSRTVTLKPPK